ncbi:hypothetical protein [Pararhodobacter oceanensis]|uniref:hypothetical protein n=1 Tax=Pararhodobacter oceanensis TaxID=2172121 RepID=UPI003A8F631A
MRKSALAGALTLVGLAACSTGPESHSAMTTGVGFGNYQRYLQSHEAARRASSTPYSVPPEIAPQIARGTAIVPPAAMPASAPSTLDAVPVRYAAAPAPAPVEAPAPSAPPTASQITTQPLAAPMQAPLRTAARPAQAAEPRTQLAAATPQPAASPASGSAVRSVQAGAGLGTTPAFDPGPVQRPGISDEQDFDAVSSRESIESDRERLAQQRAQYQVIEVASVPDHSVSGPNIVAYALRTQHAPGTTVHRRINPLRWSRWEDACLQYRNQDAAQEAFLSNGGPERDPDHLDPDGDGYACWWDPTPLRAAMAASN